MSYKSRIATDTNPSPRLLGTYVDRYIQRTRNDVAVPRRTGA